MITNYIKLALRGMGRRKFFTFISLFGISFTLGILMVILSFLQSEMGTNKPLTHKDDFVYLSSIALKRTYFDTIPVIDTSYQSGVAVYDTTYDYKETGTGMSNSAFNHKIIQEYLDDIKSAEHVSFFNTRSVSDVFVNGIKLSLQTMYADQNYWKIFDHTLLEGRPYNETDVEISAPVTVISSKTALNYFGRMDNVLNEEIIIEEKAYKVIGVYQHVGKFIPFVSPDMVIPYTNVDYSNQASFYFGGYRAMYKKSASASIQNLKDEIVEASLKVPLDHPDNTYGYEKVELKPKTYNEMFSQNIYYDEDPEKAYKYASWIITCLLIFFIVLPTLNLINLNVSRIMDRSSEIGVRKAFGAHRGNIIFQFIIENIVQTIIGGILGLGLAYLIIGILNNGGYLGEAQLILYPKFFLYSFVATLIFGVISGLLPALKMSNLQIVKALKQNKI